MPPLLSHWRAAFWLFGILGVVWCGAFALWFKNRPEENPKVNEAELAWIRSGRPAAQPAHAGVPWRRILASRNLWILCLMYFVQSYGWYFGLFYLPSFLEVQFAVPRDSILVAIYKGGPLLFGAAGCLTGGLLTDWFIRRTGNRRLGRRLFGAVGHGLTAICFAICPFLPTGEGGSKAFAFFVVIAMAGFCTDLAMGPAWAVCQDIGRRYAAIVSGFMNMIGNLGGFLASIITGFIVQKTLAAHVEQLTLQLRLQPGEALSLAQRAAGELPGYRISFFIFMAGYILGVLCWLMIDSTKPVVPEDEEQGA
jgi:MFS transporter, ACS family, glucarate transporter